MLVVLNVFFLDIRLAREVSIDTGADRAALIEALKNENYTLGAIYIVPKDTISVSQNWPEDEDAVRQSIVKFEQSYFHMVPRQGTILEWFPGSFPNAGVNDLHLIVRDSFYPLINVYDVSTGLLHEKRNIARSGHVENVAPPNTTALRSLKFYKPTQEIFCNNNQALVTLAGSIVQETLPALDQNRPLAELYPWGFVPGIVHFVTQGSTPDSGEERGDYVGELRSLKRRGDFFNCNPPKPPSSEATITSFHKAQQDDKTVISCGRPWAESVPASLFNETLCEFRHGLASATPTPGDIKCFARLRAILTKTFSKEEERTAEITRILKEEGIVAEDFDRHHITGTKYYTDGDLRVFFKTMQFLYFVAEIKNEVGTGKGDPYVESIHYWLEQIRTCINLEEVLEAKHVNFPAIIMLHFGAYLAFAVAAFTDKPVVEHLVCIPLHVHSTNDEELAAGRRAIASLRVALPKLHEYYSTIFFDELKPRAEFPFCNFFEAGGQKHYFTYGKVIEDKRVFHTHSNEEGPLCIKFCRRYSEAAHRAAMSLSLAPKLYAVNNVYGWVMVVMADISADYTTFHSLKNTFRMAAQAQVKAKLPHLHERGFVHGDIRDVNILVRKPGVSENTPYVMFIDWDWAGREGEAKYPDSMNPEVHRPPEAEVGEMIMAKHDMAMVALL